MTQTEALAELRTRVAAAGSQRAWAAANGFSAQFVCDVLNGRREISEAMANRMGMIRSLAYERVGAA